MLIWTPIIHCRIQTKRSSSLTKNLIQTSSGPPLSTAKTLKPNFSKIFFIWASDRLIRGCKRLFSAERSLVNFFLNSFFLSIFLSFFNSFFSYSLLWYLLGYFFRASFVLLFSICVIGISHSFILVCCKLE